MNAGTEENNTPTLDRDKNYDISSCQYYYNIEK